MRAGSDERGVWQQKTLVTYGEEEWVEEKFSCGCQTVKGQVIYDCGYFSRIQPRLCARRYFEEHDGIGSQSAVDQHAAEIGAAERGGKAEGQAGDRRDRA